jgi:uncharacterized protein
MKYIPRQLEAKLKQYVKQFPVVALTGARQTGKSTLLKHVYKNQNWDYVNLDKRGVLERVKADPDLFVKDIRSNIIIDEAQKAPDLFHSIKWRVDEGLKYKMILSGSANFHLLHSVTETLAGRCGVLELFPLTLNETYRRKYILESCVAAKDIKQLEKSIRKIKPVKDDAIFQHILWGGYPKLSGHKDKEFKANWFENYRTTYVERDLRDLAQVGDIGDFQRFYQTLTFQIGNILNLSNTANDVDITVPTCKRYLQLLEASYQYFLLKPYHLNISKRLIKSPKIYIWDTGLSNYFLDNSSIKTLKSGGRFGNIFENWVVSELRKQNSFLPRKVNFYFWRTSNQAEVDLIIEKGKNIIPIEIKSNVKVTKSMVKGLMNFMQLKLKKNILFGIIFYRGDRIFRFNKQILMVPINYI